MSTLSKVFVVLNLVLSVLFATFVTYFYKNAQNWHQLHDDLARKSKGDIQKLTGELEEVTAARNSLKQETEAQRSVIGQKDVEIARLDAANLVLKNDKLREEEKNASLTNNIERLTAESTNKSEQIRQLGADIEDSRRAKEDAVRKMEQAVDAAHEWEMQANEKDNLLLQLRERMVAMSKDLQQHELILQEMAHQGIAVDRFVAGAVPKIEGRVTGVLSGVVMISVGSDDGVREGYEFTVARGDRYLCKIRVDKVYPDEAAGEVLIDSLRPEASGKPEVQVNDYVSTRL